MFHQVLVEEWQRALSMLSLTLFLLVFILNSIRVHRMSRDSVAHLESLPLAPDSDESQHSPARNSTAPQRPQPAQP